MRVKKSTKKHTLPPPDAVRLIEQISKASEDDLPAVLSSFRIWRYPRGDLHGWVPVLDHFDTILEGIITSYDLDKIQTNDFTPKTKELLLDILRVHKLLLENCTSRKLFASYDRLNALLLTNDLDVLLSVVSILQRQAATYGHTIPIDRELLKKIRARLVILARGSDSLRANGFDLKTLASSSTPNVPDDIGHFSVTFYPVQQESDTLTRTGQTTLQFEASAPSIQDEIVEAAEKNHMSTDDQLEALVKARWILSLNDEGERQKLLAIRLTALATLWFLSVDDSSATLLHYEPDLVGQIAELLAPGIPELVQTAALTALDGCIRTRAKTSEVLTAVGANLSHGGLMSLLRRMVSQLVANEPLPHDFVDAALTLTADVVMSLAPTQGLPSAGLVPVLLDLLRTRVERRDSYIPRATGLMDALGSNSPQSTAEGVSTLVSRVKDEIELLLTMDLPPSSETLAEESIIAYLTNPLRAILRSLHRVQHHGAEGSRNLLDSELPKCLKRIFENWSRLGSKVFVQSINIMASFIHNEPTSLAILQEQQLPQTLFSVMEKTVPDTFEVMTASCSAIGASCLNTAGLEYVQARPAALINIIDGAISMSDPNTDKTHEVGAALDELARHHPSLRPTLFKTALDRLSRAIAAGRDFVPSEEEKKEYVYDDVQNPKSAENEPLTKLTSVLKLLEGLLHNTAMCDDFIKEGLPLLSQIPALPCLPVAFTTTEAHAALSRLYRVIGEHDHVRLVQHLVGGIKADFEATKPLWQPESPEWADKQEVQVLPGFSHRLTFLSDMLLALSYSHQRIAASMLKALGASTGTSFMSDLGALHRAAFRQHASYTPQPDLLNANPLDAAGLEDKPATKHSAVQFLSTRVHAMCTKLYRAIIRSLFHKRGTDAAFKKESSALGKQIALDIVKHLESVHEPRPETVAVGLTTLLLFDDRGPDGRLSTVVFVPFQKAGGIKVLLDVCERITKRMDELPAPDPPKAKPEGNTTTEAKVSNAEPTAEASIEASKDTMDVDPEKPTSRLTDQAQTDEERATDERRKIRTQVTASLRIALLLLGALVSPHSLVDAPQALVVPDESWKPHEILIRLRLDILPLLHRIWSAEWLVTMPVPVIKIAVRAFSTAMAGDGEIGRPQTAVAGGAANALLGAIAPVVAHVPAVRAPVVADPARVDQLVDMGFPRTSAELALVRARNNVAAATDLILMMPHLFEGEGDAGNGGSDNANQDENGNAENNEETMEGREEDTQAGEAPEAELAAAADANAAPTPARGDAAAASSSDAPTGEVDAAGSAEIAAASESNETANTDETTDATPTNDSSMDVDPSGPANKEQLDSLRASYKPDVPARALVIVDHAEDLVFDVMSAFPRDLEGIKLLLDHALKCVNEESDKRDDHLAARLRLAAVFIRHNGDVALDHAAQETVCEIVAPLSIDVSPRPRWTCALLLFAEAAFASSESLVLAKIGDEATNPTEDTDALDMAVGYLSISIHTILEDQNSTRDELISAMRLLVVVTRHRKELITPETIRLILAPFKNPTGKLSGCQPYVSMIVRHAFEDRETLVSAMRREIRQYLTKNKITDINHFARQVKHIAARDPAAFVEAVKKECALNDPSPAQSVYHIRSLNESERDSAPAAHADPFSDSQDDQSSAPIMDTLLGELGVAVQTEGSHTYGGLVVALLTEVLGSYVAPKRVFLSSLRRQGIFVGGQSGKNGLATIINDVVCKISLNDLESPLDPKTPTESSRRLMLSSWASSMLVGLSCDPGGDLQEDAEALTSVRKTILDLIAKSLKDPTTNLDPGAKYGRLFALAELVYGLLLVKSGQPPVGSAAKQETASVQVAKIMLEKSFVGLITAATGEVDLNYPGVKVVLTSLLRALDHLTKVAIKWSKNDKEKKDDITDDEDASIEDDDVDMSTDFDEDEEDEEGDEEQEAPDLYRNSALGMHMMDEDDDGEDEEGDEDEDMIEGYDEEMDDGMEDDESGTEPSSDDDDDDEEDPEDWTDEEMDPDDGDEVDEGPEVVIGDADPIDEEDWEDEEDGVDGTTGQDLLDRIIHDPEEEDYDEDDLDDEGIMDEMDDLDEMDEMDEEEFDEMIMDHADGPSGQYEAVDPGYWGWGGPGEAPQPSAHRSRMAGGGPASALFGMPSAPSAQRSGPSDAPAVPALLSEPAVAPEDAMRSRFPTRHAHELFSTIEGMGGPQAVRMMESLIQRSERSGGHDPIRISFARGEDGVVDVTIGGRSFPINTRPQAPAEPTPADITMELGPKPSAQRWNEEAKLSPNGTREMLSRVVIHMINHLLPAAKKRQEEAEEKRKKEEEVAKKKQEEEDKKREEEQKKKDEEDAKKRKEEVELAMSVDLPPSRATPVAGESSNAAETAATIAASAEPNARDVHEMAIGDLIELGGEDTEMLDAADVLAQALTSNALGGGMSPITPAVTEAQPEASGSGSGGNAEGSGEPAHAEPTLARTVVQIRGRDVDITDSGIDLEFLQALPEDMRADVVEQHLREQNSARLPPVPAIPLGDGDISAEFLDALPPDLRDEVVAAQAAESARRQRNTGGGAAAAPAGAGSLARHGRPLIHLGSSEMVSAIHPAGGAGRGSRARDLLDMPEPPFFEEMPEEMREMMMGAGGPGVLRGLLRGAQGLRRRLVDATAADETKRQPPRESIQLLEKPGIASLTRLLFFPETFKKDRLFRILANLCENSTTRSDLLNLLLSVLQDGSGELPMVDKSFQQMSIKNMATPKSVLKAKTPGTTGTEVQTPGPTGAASSSQGWNATNLFSHLQTENIPTFIAQRCLEALTHILGNNTQAVNFFLTEHEQGVGLRKVGGKKGKGKEKEKVLPQIKYPIVILLGLLERTGLLGTQGVMESLTALLVTVTRPLPGIKAEIEKAEKEKEKGKQSAEGQRESGAASQGPGGDVAMADSAATTTVTSALEPAATTATPAPASATAQTPAPAKKEEKKEDNLDKAKPLVLTRYPVIPAPTLRLVINALTTGECSSKNFSQTLVVLQNLSCIPDAQPVLLQELQERSQKLGMELRSELSTLASALEDELFETSNPALTIFSSPSATQAQLLRLLKTIEYIHLKRDDTDPPGEEMTPEESAVSAIYQSFDFDPMWTILQQCLTVVEKREDTKQIALILLPLVEALMVVCKYRRSTRLREARSPSAGTGPMSPMSPMSPTSATTSLPIDKYEGDLFLSFTTHHRKVLNEIVRSSPALLSGSFSLLIHNPRVLEFDNKRQWFFQKLKKKRTHVHGGQLSLTVRRQYVFQDSFDALRYSSGDEIKYGKIGVKFKGEDGIDAGGVTREWYSVLAKQIFDPNFALFEPCAADKQTYQPNKNSSVNGDQHMAYFKFIGRIIGKAVYDGRLLDAYFNRAFYKQILGRTVDMRDLESIDPEYHKSLQWMLDNDITGVIDQEFTIEDEQFGEKKIVELKPGGADIPVTEENKEEYVRLVVSYRLDNSIKDQIKAFLDGFYDIIPRNLIQIFEPDQLELLISGMSTIDVDELKNATQMSGWKPSDPEINWFWRALRSFSQEERSRFLMFVTSSSRVPLGGFTQLQGASGTQPFQLQKLYAKEGSLPQASTCFNLLLLPTYSSYEQLKERLQFAVTETGGFGKA